MPVLPWVSRPLPEVILRWQTLEDGLPDEMTRWALVVVRGVCVRAVVWLVEKRQFRDPISEEEVPFTGITQWCALPPWSVHLPAPTLESSDAQPE